MSHRRASSALGVVSCAPPLPHREPPAPAQDWDALEWQGSVRLDPERAALASASHWQAHVRKGLLERLMSLGADHIGGPHAFRPDTARRVLAHLDALGEAGLVSEELVSFAAEQDLEDVGAPWTLALLFGCLQSPGIHDALQAWVDAIDPLSLPTYRIVSETARALHAAPHPLLQGLTQSWLSSANPVSRALAIEGRLLHELSDADLLACARVDQPLVWTALERLVARSPKDPARRLPPLPRWTDHPPHLAVEVARARLVARDWQPLRQLRLGDEQAIAALGPYVLGPLALAAAAEDNSLALDLSRNLPTTPSLLNTLGLVGLPSLFPRLIAASDDEDLAEEAHEALSTALGAAVPRPSAAAWEQVTQNLPTTATPLRFRGGLPYSAAAVCAEAQRPELSALEVEARAAELFLLTGRRIHVPWAALGATLETALSELSRLVR